jgi:hypothetical protein
LLIKQIPDFAAIETAVQGPFRGTDEITGFARQQVNIQRELVKYKLCHFIAA